jgi:hypothetical protein
MQRGATRRGGDVEAYQVFLSVGRLVADSGDGRLLPLLTSAAVGSSGGRVAKETVQTESPGCHGARRGVGGTWGPARWHGGNRARALLLRWGNPSWDHWGGSFICLGVQVGKVQCPKFKSQLNRGLLNRSLRICWIPNWLQLLLQPPQKQRDRVLEGRAWSCTCAHGLGLSRWWHDRAGQKWGRRNTTRDGERQPGWVECLNPGSTSG